MLLSSGSLHGEESAKITGFYAEVETLNRGLDYASAARGNSKKLEAEDRRNRLKAERICRNGNIYKSAIDVTRAHTKKSNSFFKCN